MEAHATISLARRVARVAATPAALLGAGVRVAQGGFAAPNAVDVALTALTLGCLARRVAARRDPADPVSALLALALAAHAVAATGGVAGPLAALPVVLVAAAVALGRKGSWLPVAYGVALEGALHLASPTPSWPSFGARVGLLVAAAALHHGLTRAELARVRADGHRALQDERVRQREDARSLRLNPVEGARSTAHDAARERASLDEVHASLVGLLTLVRRSMGLRTCALFWVNPAGALRLVEAATDDDLVTDDLPQQGGALGAVIRLGQPVLRAGLRGDAPSVTYYAGAAPVRAFAAVPVRDGDDVRGVFVGDRDDDRAFHDDDRAVLEAAALQARRLIDNERVFARLHRARNELATLFSAARALGEAMTEAQVLDAVVAAAREVVACDLVVVATWSAGVHRVRRVAGEAPESLQRCVFDDNAGIASAVVRNRHALPYKGHFDPDAQFVFTRTEGMEAMRSALCLPMVVRDNVVGTLTLAAKRRGAFGGGAGQLLGVLAGNAAVALANAAAVQHLEALATTDPMTGHLNPRALEAEFERRLRAATRFRRPLGLIVLDIDKFKNVNDTYGHAVGDVVIKGLGAVLARCRRETDAVARFGGEEFVVVCEETDAAGAMLLAERIREELARQVFRTDKGELRVTCSLGVAAFPQDAAEFGPLFEKADAALYVAKQSGRNQSRAAGAGAVRAA